MKLHPDNSGSATIQLVMIMGILSLGLASALTLAGETGRCLATVASGLREEAELWKKAGQAKEGIEVLWGDGRGPSHQQWLGFCQDWKESGCVIDELSSCINPNWVPFELLAGKGFASWFEEGGTAGAMGEFRSVHGFTLDPSRTWKGFFSPGFSFDLVSPWSSFNLLAGDESALAQGYGAFTRDAVSADVFRYRLHEARINGRIPDTQGLTGLLAPHARELEGFFSLRPAFNLNLVDRRLLDCLLHSPLFALDDPDEALACLASLREKSFVSRLEIPFRRLGCRNKPLTGPGCLASWLGDDSEFFGLEIRGMTRMLRLVFRARSREDGRKNLETVFQAMDARAGESDHET